MRTTVYKELEVEVDLDDFESDILLQELKCRGDWDANILGYDKEMVDYLVDTIYHKKISDKDYTKELDELIWYTIGRM